MRFLLQLYSPVLKDYGSNLWTMGKTAEELGIINQKGLNRKVMFIAHAPMPLHGLTLSFDICSTSSTL